MSLNKNIKAALKLINTGQWLQLEGSIGRWCNDFIESEVIIKDEKATNKKGPVKFRDGYGRWHNQYRFKINHLKLEEVRNGS